jgi:MFS family permease
LGEYTRDRWYTGVTRYQWLVLVIASLGWVFDVFEGQIFVASMNEAMPALLPAGASPSDIPFYRDITLGMFLVGGALGGVLFGLLSDRIGRTRTMVLTILVYSLFTCLSAFAQTWWHMAVFRFLVALGTGGEWAVASAFVAEVFPTRARAWSLAIFHASSVFGTLLAVAAGAFIVPELGWRWGFAVGVLPALLTVWIRAGLQEPEAWVRSRAVRTAAGQRAGAVGELFRGALLRRTLVGVGLATVGLATYWGTHIYGKDALQRAAGVRLVNVPVSAPAAEWERAVKAATPELKRELKHWEMLGMLLVTTGAGLGLVAFGPVSEWLGRRGAFLLFHLGGLAAALALFQALSGVVAVALFLPVFGFLTVGMHAGYAVYFPELFPTRLRSTGSGFCFNVGRFTAAPVIALSGWLQSTVGLSLPDAAALLSVLFLVGAALLFFAPETRGTELSQ